LSADRIRVGIVAPMWSEAQCFLNGRAPRERLTEIEDGVLLRVSGIGGERAALAARELLSSGTTALVCAGVAGGLDPALGSGSLLIADRVIASDGREHATDGAWRRALSDRLRPQLECALGAVCQSSAVLARPADKRLRFESTHALAVDMESAAVVIEAERANVPCLVLRAVCDPADQCIPASALAAADPEGRPRVRAFVSALIRHPAEMRAVLRLNRAFRAAQESLSSAVRIAGPRLCAEAR
jgi:nucleoside phosphorylase